MGESVMVSYLKKKKNLCDFYASDNFIHLKLSSLKTREKKVSRLDLVKIRFVTTIIKVIKIFNKNETVIAIKSISVRI